MTRARSALDCVRCGNTEVAHPPPLSSPQQPIILSVRPDPHPFDATILQLPGDGAVVVADPHRKAMPTTGQALKMQRWMLGIRQPKVIVLGILRSGLKNALL